MPSSSASCTPKGQPAPRAPEPVAGGEDGRHHRAQEQEVASPVDAQRLVLHHLLELRARALGLLAREHDLVPDVEDHQQQAVHEQPLPPELEGPAERHALQEAEEERRIAERREQPAAVRHDEDEEDHHVGLALARRVRAQQRPDQQHRGAGGADRVREHGAQAEQRGVEQRGSRERAAHADPAGDREEGAEQQDEGRVLLGLLEQLVKACRLRARAADREPRGARRARRPGPCFDSTPRNAASRAAGSRSRAAGPRTGAPSRTGGSRAWVIASPRTSRRAG